MKKLILTIFLATIINYMYGTIYSSKDEYAGNWENILSWNTSKPPTTFTTTNTVNINGTITVNGDLTFNNNGTININSTDTLIVLGDLTMNNNAIVSIQSNGVLIVIGSLSVNNGFDILAGGKVVVMGDFTANNNTDISSGPLAGLYVFGSVNAPDITYSGSLTGIETLKEFLSNQPELTGIIETITGNSLPIELIQFDAKNNGTFILVNWVTASEVNNDYFTLFKSLDGYLFTEIYNTIGAGNSNTISSYEFIDNKFESEKQYYKLRQTDYDGLYSDSDIICVKTDVDNCYFKITKDYILILIHNTDIESRIIITDTNGNIIFSKIFMGVSSVNIPNTLPKGVYIISNINNKNISSRKIIVD